MSRWFPTKAHVLPKPKQPRPAPAPVPPDERAYLRRIMDALERQSFAAKLQDLGEDECAVCRANRLREAWDPDEEARA